MLDRRILDRLMLARSAALMALHAACWAQAQILPKIPPAPAPAREYVPPPPPKPVEVKPPEPEIEVPSLVARDGQGKLKTYDTTLETAAVRGALSAGAFPNDKVAAVNASLAARRSALMKWAVENLDKVKAAVAAGVELADLKDFNQLARARDAANALQQQSALDRLVQDGAISVLMRTRFDRAVIEYSDARREQWEKETGLDIMKIAGYVGRQAFFDQTRDVLAALDQLIVAAAPTLRADIAALASLTPEQNAALDALDPDVFQAADPEKGASRVIAIRAFLLDTLKPEQAAQVLRPHIPAPAAR